MVTFSKAIQWETHSCCIYDWQVSLQEEASLLLTTSLSAFTNQIGSWDLEHNFEFSWQQTYEVLVLGKQNFQEPFEFTTKQNKTTHLYLSTPSAPLHPQTVSTPRNQLTVFCPSELLSLSPCFTPEGQKSSWRLQLLASNCRQVKLFLNYKAKLRVPMSLWPLVLGQITC